MKQGDRGENVKALQTFLKNEGFLVGKADGIYGKQTEQAVRFWQADNGLRADGIFGANSEALARKKGFAPDAKAIEFCLPESGTGFVTYRRESSGADQYGTSRTIAAIISLATKWHIIHPEAPMQIGNISRRGGGKFPPHATHRTGDAFDMRPFRKDAQSLPVAYTHREYDQFVTEEFLKLLKANYPARIVYFNDPVMIKRGLSSYSRGHSDHIHVVIPQ